MDRLWAPWRSKYINSRKKKRCIFCKPKEFVVRESRLSFAMLNIYPYNNGHIMVAPKRHVKTIEHLTEAEICDLMKLVIEAKKVLNKRLKPHGYNIGFNVGRDGGAGFAGHMHIHIVPRWRGDTNFMPMVSGTKVLSDSLDATYKLFKKR